MSNERPIDAKEAAQILGVTPRTVIRLADKGEIVGFKVGDVWRFRRLDLENYIEEQIARRKRSPE
jgi:excisionase family DNA binding protein